MVAVNERNAVLDIWFCLRIFEAESAIVALIS